MANKGPRSQCPIALTLDIIGDKWTLLILRDIIIRGKRHYQDFLQSKEKIATNLLADRLVRLESMGLITKKKDPSNGKQYLYDPTAKGMDLLPILFNFMKWGIKHAPDTDLSIPFVARLLEDEEALRKEIIAQYE